MTGDNDHSDPKPVIDNQTALEKLRELFSDYLDLEQEIYQLYESQLNSFGIKLGFYFEKQNQVDFKDFFSKYTLWQVFMGSCHLPDILAMDLRLNMSRPWFLGRDFFDVEIQIDNQKLLIKSEQPNGHFLDLQKLLSRVKLFNEYPGTVSEHHKAHDFYHKFTVHKYFIIKLIRVKKDESGFRKYLEVENCLLSTEEYRDKLEKIFQLTIKEILQGLDMTEEVIRLHLQERLSLWGFRFSKMLTEEELLRQYSIVKLGNIFPAVLDGALFIQALTYNSNEEVIEAIKNNDYKKLLHKFISRLEKQKILLLKYNGVNLDGHPEFLLNLREKAPADESKSPPKT
jgi:hypothetical protein